MNSPAERPRFTLPSAIVGEVVRLFCMTFIDRRKNGVKSWTSDRPLMLGYLLGLPFFAAAVLMSGFPSMRFDVLFIGAVIANLVWLASAAWIRFKSDMEPK